MPVESHTSRTPSPLDELDMKLLHALETDGRAPFSKIAAVLGVSDQTVARRYRKLTAEGGLNVVGVRNAERLGTDFWMLRLRCTPEGAQTIAGALARRPDTSWVALMSGGTEVTCLTRPRRPGDHDDLLLGKLPRTPHIVEIRAFQLLHSFFGGPRGWLSKFAPLSEAQLAALTPRLPPVTGAPARIAPEDEALVTALEADGRATYPELQRATGLSESSVKRRLSALLESRAVFVDVEYTPELLGYHVAASLWITAAPAALHSVGEALASHYEIAFASATAGPSNLLATVVARDTAGLYAYISGKLGQLEGVQHVETTPFLRRVKQLTYRQSR
ncbi:Lrp/AsnC family transcriptional regulator [Streptomyces aureoverticillatus]|uniref:Lrp/AsnC family transcriptional regulator n=1 Tax=Streptomyces aureoverticillatus TaxID=66871 RepID=UPI0023BA733B|nr:Lrp/AsnC family transcriptional regulator [Streptomyces aureoverticillatus]